jgi:hypothetical protein
MGGGGSAGPYLGSPPPPLAAAAAAAATASRSPPLKPTSSGNGSRDSSKKQGAYGKVKSHSKSAFSQLLRVDEVFCALRVKFAHPFPGVDMGQKSDEDAGFVPLAWYMWRWFSLHKKRRQITVEIMCVEGPQKIIYVSIRNSSSRLVL